MEDNNKEIEDQIALMLRKKEDFNANPDRYVRVDSLMCFAFKNKEGNVTMGINPMSKNDLFMLMGMFQDAFLKVSLASERQKNIVVPGRN